MTDEEMQDPEEETSETGPEDATELMSTFGGEEDPQTAEMPAATSKEEAPTEADAPSEEPEPAEEPKPKKDPKAGWVTAAMPKAQPQEQRPPSSEPAVPKLSESKPATPAVEPSPLSSAAAPMPASQEGKVKEGPNSIEFMEKLGIDNPQTQRIVLGGVAGVLFLCCGCSCVVAALSFLPAN